MSSDVEPRSSLLENILAGRRSSRLILALVVIVGLLVLTPVLVLLLRNAPPPASRNQRVEQGEELTQVVDDFVKETDLITLKNGVQRLNSHYNQFTDQRPPGLDADQRERLQKALNLDADELAEIDSGTYSVLDAHYLDECFLLRDAARALQADATTAAAEDPALRLTSLDQATAAFNWVTRQVRLEQASALPLPPQFVLRRGLGTALDRSLIFLDLLRQLNADNEEAPPLTGCLVVEPGASEAQQRLWAVGVVIDGQVYLFDPRLGLPIPGPEGKGVATLATAATDPHVLAQLTVKDKLPYDVNAEQARGSDVYLYVPLPALSPRMAHLQKKVLAPRIHVNLAADLFREEAAVRAALDGAGMKTAKVRTQPQALRLLRAFLPVDEGGADRTPFGMPLNYLPGFTEPGNAAVVQMFRKRYYEFDLVPWQGLPDQFRGFPHNVGLGSFIREQYAQPFRQSALEPKGARDLILRGEYPQVIHDLIDERDNYGDKYRQWQKAKQAAGGEEAFDRRVGQWLADKAVPAAANMERAKQSGPEALEAAGREVVKVWTSGAEANTLLNGAIAAQRRPQVTYLLALAKQERAEQLQLRLDETARRSGGGLSKGDAARAQTAWRSAEEWWRHYADEYPKGPAAAAIRRPRGRCQMMLGDWQAAVATWEDVSEDRTHVLPAQEKAGNLYLADRLRKQHAAGGKP